MTLKHLVLIAISLVATGFAWMYGFQWMQSGGNILNLPSFFIEPLKLGGAAAFLTVDILAAWFAYMIWVVGDAQRIGLGAKAGWGFLALSFIGTCFAFPIYLVVRERHLDKQGKVG